MSFVCLWLLLWRGVMMNELMKLISQRRVRMDTAWKPFMVVCLDVSDPFKVQDGLALEVDMILFDIIEGY